MNKAFIQYRIAPFIFFTFLSCGNGESKATYIPADTTTQILKKVIDKPEPVLPAEPSSDSLLLRFGDLGLVNVRELDSSIRVELKYSTKDNFLHEDVYGNLEEAFLQKEVAEKLVRASSYLKKTSPGYTLIIYDAVRPLSIQWKMWRLLKMPVHEKKQYVSNPAEGSLHNFGAAVDVSILGPDGKELDMGTAFDHFGVLAFPEKEDSLVRAGALKQQQVQNRALLRKVMYRAGFFNIQTEWWHFNSCTRDSAKVKYKLVE